MKNQKLKPYQLLDKEDQLKLCPFIIDIVRKAYDKVPKGLDHLECLKLQSKFSKQVAAYLIRENTSLSLSEIGNFFKAGQSINVKYAHERIRMQLFYEDELQKDINKLQSLINDEISKLINNQRTELGQQKVYNINLNDFTSFRFEDNRFIIAIGFSEKDINDLNTYVLKAAEVRNHKNTGLNLLEDISDHGEAELVTD